MSRIGFADESLTHASTQCYGIGVLSMDSAHLADFEAYINERRSFHNVTGELKWKEIANRFSDINFILDCLDAVLAYDSVAFDVIVVDAKQYKN